MNQKRKKAEVKRRKGGVSRKPKHDPLEEQESWTIDGTDEVTNGMIIAGYSVFTFLQVWWEAVKLVGSLVRRLKPSNDDED